MTSNWPPSDLTLDEEDAMEREQLARKEALVREQYQPPVPPRPRPPWTLKPLPEDGS